MSTPEQTVILLLDTYWFSYGVFSAKPLSTPLPNPTLLQQQQEQVSEEEKPKLNRINTQMRKSSSDHFLNSKDSSPNSVLTSQLQTILSGKETKHDFPPPKTEKTKKSKKKRRNSTNSRSLSELEFEEVKGFMDLGFVFSNNDKDSKLVSIIPGLQRLGKNPDDDPEKSLLVSRPYLSEAWECLEEEEERKKRNSPLVDWKILPSFRNEMEMKNHLRVWAHTVASTVR